MAVARPYHHGNLREALLEAGERALEDGGAQSLSLRELAREVGVSHAAPRRHFAGRQALLDALAQAGFERLGAELAAAIAGDGAPLEERFGALARAYVRFATARPALLELMFAAKHAASAPPELRAAGERAFLAPHALIAEGQAAGGIVPGDPELVALVAFAAIQGLVALANTGLLPEGVPLDAIVDATIERLMLGLRPR